MTARMGVSVERLPQEVLLEGFYRDECSGTIQVERVHVFEELLAVFNCSVLTFWSAIKFHREYRTRVRYNMIPPMQLLFVFSMLLSSNNYMFWTFRAIFRWYNVRFSELCGSLF
jgi:hypothetical protein